MILNYVFDSVVTIELHINLVGYLIDSPKLIPEAQNAFANIVIYS